MTSPFEDTDEILADDALHQETDFTSGSDDYLLDEIDVYIQANLEDEIVKEALKTGVDLRHYSKTVEVELLEVENASILDYIRESKNIASLHAQIASCDQVLQVMEEMLNGFQSNLKSISNEIQTLQQQSVMMSQRLKNRQAIRGELSQFVDEMVVPEAMISHILETPVTEREFLEQLHELNHKINFVKEQSFKEARSSQDVKDVVEKLKFKALEKIRDFLLQKIYQFRKPMTNYQIPQNAMLKFRFFNEFLMTHERHVAKEIRDEYVETMSKIYYSYFKSYSNRLMKLQYDEVPDKDDLMGVEDTAKRSFFSAKPSLKSRSTIFTLGNRGSVLTTDLEGPIIVPHAAQKGEQKYPYEALFRSLHFALVDNGCREYLFVSDFFIVTGSAALDFFNQIFGKTMTMFIKQMDVYTSECYDAIALFLCIHIIHRYKVVMHKRMAPVLDRYWDTLLEMFYPRFEHLLQMNIQSIRDCEPQRLGHIDVRPHYITRRYAEFSAAVVGLNESFSNERVNDLLSQLQNEVENFILRMAAEFPQRREQLIFLINNYDMMLTVIVERTTDNCKESESFKELLSARSQEFIEEILQNHFGGLIAFVKECEGALDQGNAERMKSEERKIVPLVRGFNNDWKKAIEIINQDTMRSFTNFKNGTQILQGALTQLIQYYHRFHKVLSQKPFANLPIRSELINIHNVMVEVKKHKPNF